MNSHPRKAAFAISLVAVAGLSIAQLAERVATASAQTPAPPITGQASPGHGSMPGMTQGHGQMPGSMPHDQPMMGMPPRPGQPPGNIPAMPGQDAFGAVQEIVGILEADPKTDWSKVDLESLRRHLVDMNEVTLNAEASSAPIAGGLEIRVTGSRRTLAAIQRMVPAHAAEVDRVRLNSWSATAEVLPDGVRLRVTAADPAEVAHIRGLGFIGILASGAHHQPHHLAMAKGEPVHAH